MESSVPGLRLGTWAVVAEVADLALVSNQITFEVDLCEVDVTLDRVTVVEGQGTLDGELELHLTAVLPVSDVHGRPATTALRWPSRPRNFVRLGEGQSDFPRALITTYRVRAGQPSQVSVQVTLREEDSFLLFNDDVGTGSGMLTVSCEQENTLVLNISFSGQVSVDSSSCRTDEVTGELVCEHSTLNKAGNVAVAFKATPRAGP